MLGALRDCMAPPNGAPNARSTARTLNGAAFALTSQGHGACLGAGNAEPEDEGALMNLPAVAAAAALAVLLAAPLRADPLEDARAAYLAVWNETPLAVRTAVFVTGPAAGYGLQEERGSNAFGIGEPIHIYLEPVGYGWEEEGGINRFGMDIGLRILTPEAQELFAQESFLNLTTQSAAMPTEFFGNVTLNLSGLTSGSYVLELVLDDIASDETSTVAMPIEVR